MTSAHTNEAALRGIHHAVAADTTAREIVVRLAQARASAGRTMEEAATLGDLADLDAALLIERYYAGGQRPLRHLVDALADLAVDGWIAVSRLLEVDPAELMEESDRRRG